MDFALERETSWISLSPLEVEDQPLLSRLAERLRGGDAAVIERVLRELIPMLERLARRLLGPRPDVEDVTQEMLTEIASALHRFEGRSSISTLAHRIAVRTASRFYRRAPRRSLTAEADLDAIPLVGASPEESLASRRAAQRLYQHLDSLSEIRRTAFVLCCIEEMTPTEAAEIVGISAVVMRSRVFEARNELADLLARDRLRERREGGDR